MWHNNNSDHSQKILAVIERERNDDMKSHMNSQHPRITFTTKEEQNRSLLFMDVCFNRREDGKLMRQVYQKPTHTNRSVMFGSYHPMDVMDVMF